MEMAIIIILTIWKQDPKVAIIKILAVKEGRLVVIKMVVEKHILVMA